MPTGLTYQPSDPVTSCGWTAGTGEQYAEVDSWKTSTIDPTPLPAPSERMPTSWTYRQPYKNTELSLYHSYMLPLMTPSRARWFHNPYR